MSLVALFPVCVLCVYACLFFFFFFKMLFLGARKVGALFFCIFIFLRVEVDKKTEGVRRQGRKILLTL